MADEATNQESSSTVEQPQPDDTTSLKKALERERLAREKAERILKDREEKEALASKTLAEQVAVLQTQLKEMDLAIANTEASYKSQLTRKEIDFAFTGALTKAGVIPEYSGLLLQHAADLELNEGKVRTKAGEPLEKFTESLKGKYPHLFAAGAQPAGSGATAPAGTGKPQNGKIVVNDSNFMANLDAIAAGKAEYNNL